TRLTYRRAPIRRSEGKPMPNTHVTSHDPRLGAPAAVREAQTATGPQRSAPPAIVPYVSETPHIPRRLLRCHPTPWHRRTGVPVRLTPPCTSVHTTIVTIVVGLG